MPRKHTTIRAREEAHEARLGKTFCHGWGPDAPDMSGANDAARDQAAIAREQWNDWKTDFAPVVLRQMQEQIDIGRDAYGLAREAQDFQLGLQRRYDDRYWRTQVPLENEILRDVRMFDTEAERERLAGQAMGDVEQAASASRGINARAMASMGVNPNDGRYAAVMRQGGIDRTLAAATAMNKVRQAAQQMGWARKNDAAALLRGLPGFSSNASQLAQGWSGQGIQAGGMGLNGATSAAGAGDRAAQVAGNNFQGAAQSYARNAEIAAKYDPSAEMLGVATGMAGSLIQIEPFRIGGKR